MMKLYKCTSIFIILIVYSSINVGQSVESGNWLTKSLDYYSLEKCSSLDKSSITGDFYGCLNSPSTGSKSPSSDQNNLGSGGWGGFGSNGVPGRKKRGVGNFESSSFFSGQSGFGTSKNSQSKPSDSGKLMLANDLQHIINCFPKLIKPCMIGSEIQFFNTIKDFFQAQFNYVTNASLIATKMASSQCVKSNSIDTSTICYSTNIHKQNWFGWKINWFDGQMCHFIDDISECEISSFDKCPSDVKLFVNGLWDAGLRATPCLNQTNEKKTTPTSTASSPLSVAINPVNLTKSLAPGSSGKEMPPKQLPSHLNHVTNIDFDDQQSLNDMNNLKVNDNSKNSVSLKTRDDNSQLKFLVPERRRHSIPEKRNNNEDLNGFYNHDQQPDSIESNENNYHFDDGFTTGSKTNDFHGEMKHSKRVRLHEVDGEGESRHNHDENHRDIEEEQWSKVKEEFRRKMRESIESQESDEDEYEEESEESDEDKDFEILESRINPSVMRQKNEEDEYRDSKNSRKNTGDFRSYNKNAQRKRLEWEKKRNQRKVKEAESRRIKERQDEMRRRGLELRALKQRNEIETRKREDEQRKAEEDQRIREEIERNLERERQEEARRQTDHKKILRPESWISPENDWANNEHNHQMNENEQGHHPDESSLKDCFESPVSSWVSLNDNSANMMDLMCRKMKSIKTCLDKRLADNRLDHFKVMQKSFCDENNKFKDAESISNVMKCLIDHNSSSGQVMQTRYPNRSPSKFWN